MFVRLIVSCMLFGFLAIALLLATNHYGFATKVTDYFFWFLVLVVVGGLLKQ